MLSTYQHIARLLRQVRAVFLADNIKAAAQANQFRVMSNLSTLQVEEVVFESEMSLAMWFKVTTLTFKQWLRKPTTTL